MPTALAERRLAGDLLLILARGDLTEAPLDAIVNAANPQLQHGGGLAAAIVRRGGVVIQQESDEWVRRHGPAGYDRPAVTGAGRLPARYVIHVVGPMWGEGDEDRKLRLAVQSALQAAADLNLATLGLPAISTGIFGFPVDRAAPIILRAVADFAGDHPSASLRRIEIVLFDAPTLDVFRRALSQGPDPDPKVAA